MTERSNVLPDRRRRPVLDGQRARRRALPGDARVFDRRFRGRGRSERDQEAPRRRRAHAGVGPDGPGERLEAPGGVDPEQVVASPGER